MKLYTHLNFGGNCEEAFLYYEKHLGGRITTMMKVGDLPAGAPAPPGSPEAVIHARMNVAGVETFFASRFAQVWDRFGTLWTILHERSG